MALSCSRHISSFPTERKLQHLVVRTISHIPMPYEEPTSKKFVRKLVTRLKELSLSHLNTNNKYLEKEFYIQNFVDEI